VTLDAGYFAKAKDNVTKKICGKKAEIPNPVERVGSVFAKQTSVLEGLANMTE